MKNEDLYRRVLALRGVVRQMCKLAEEQGELIQALDKAVIWGEEHIGRSPLPQSYKDDIAQEMIDCYHLMDQMILAFGVEQEALDYFEQKQTEKLERKVKELEKKKNEGRLICT